MSQYFLSRYFSMSLTFLGPLFTCLINFAYGFDFAEILAYGKTSAVSIIKIKKDLCNFQMFFSFFFKEAVSRSFNTVFSWLKLIWTFCLLSKLFLSRLKERRWTIIALRSLIFYFWSNIELTWHESSLMPQITNYKEKIMQFICCCLF